MAADARRLDGSKSTVKDVNTSMSNSYLAALNVEVPLPGGYSTTRREVLKLGSLAIGLGSSYFALTHLKALSYASPKALLNALQGVGRPLLVNGSELARPERVRQFKQYIRELESKGAGQTVPDFKPKLEWLNTTPLSLKKDLTGKVVVLDFWTYCCINCMHVLPDLAYLENKYRDQPMTVVGVHSAKFDNEKDLGAIRNAVLRYDVTHPVVNDGDMTMWRQLGVSSWPTLAVVSPRGRLIAMLAGEGHREDLDDLVEAALEFYGEKKLLDARPLTPSLEKEKDARLVASPLKFPGKLATDLVNGRLFISDSNHHRIVVTDLDGSFIAQVGSGGEGLKDGSFTEALFNRPQGVAYNAVKNVLYVADTENHALREIDFVKETVRTLAGNGTKGADYRGGKKGSAQVLNSPWDVAHDPEAGLVYIALAGQHQIWLHKIADETTEVFSGDGYERNLNGRRGKETSFAQPSGISLTPDLKSMYLADSESSSVRRVDLTTGGSKLLAGGDPTFSDNLFQFGDKDGVGSKALLQHPLGVLHSPAGLVYVADSYNHKIKVLDPSSQKVTTVAGTGTAGFKDGAARAGQLSEPAGIALGVDGKLYVADTNNSLIRVLDLQAQGGPKLETLELKGVQPPTPAEPTGPRRLRQRLSSDTQVIRIDPVDALNGDLQLQISLASGYHFSKEAQSKYEVELETDSGIILDPPTGIIGQDGTATIHFKRDPTSASKGATRVSCKVYFCEEDQVCLYKALAFDVPFSSEVAGDRAQRVSLPALVKPAEVARKSFTGKV